MEKLNCWEFKKCERELGGQKSFEFGVCPAATQVMLDSVHGGTNAGRSCWVVSNTICDDTIQGDFLEKYKYCGECDFYALVKKQEGNSFVPTVQLFDKIGGEA